MKRVFGWNTIKTFLPADPQAGDRCRRGTVSFLPLWLEKAMQHEPGLQLQAEVGCCTVLDADAQNYAVFICCKRRRIDERSPAPRNPHRSARERSRSLSAKSLVENFTHTLIFSSFQLFVLLQRYRVCPLINTLPLNALLTTLRC